jgi:CBS domain-containing protein
MLIRDVMQTEVATLRVDDTLDLASDIMELGRIRHLPVLSAGVVAGVVSQRDLYRAAVSSLLELRSSAQRDWTSVQTIAPTDSVHDAVELMLRHRIGCLPVVEHGTLVGLVSETDLLRHLGRVLGISETKLGLPELPQ